MIPEHTNDSGTPTSVLGSVGIVHPFPIYRAGLAKLLTEEGYDVTFSVGTLAEVRPFAMAFEGGEAAADVVIAADRLSDGRGSQLANSCGSSVLLLSEAVSAYVLDEAERTGCVGLIAKTHQADDLRRAMSAVISRRTYFPEKSGMVELTRSTQLTDRELELLMLLSEGRSVKSIAQRLSLSVHTVRNHVRAILRKMNASTQLEAVLRAHTLGLVRLHAEV